MSRPASSRYRREVLISAVVSGVVYSLGFLTGPVIARTVGPSGRGELAAILTTTMVLGWMVSLGLPSAVAYYVDQDTVGEYLSTTTAFGLLVGVPISATLWVVWPLLLTDYSHSTVMWARAFLVLIPLSVGTQAAIDVLRRQGAGLRFNLWRTTPITVSGGGILALALSGRLTTGTALAANFVGMAVPMVLLGRLLWAQPSRPSRGALRLLLPYGVRTALSSHANVVTARLDQVVLAATVAPRQLGLYAVAVTAVSAASPVTSAVSLAMFGHLRGESSSEVAGRRFRLSVLLVLCVSVATALTLATVGPLILRVVFGAPFSAAALPLRLLLPGQVALDLIGPYETRLFAEGRPADVARAAVIGCIITLVAVAALVPRGGIVAAAAVSSVAAGAQFAYLALRLHRPPKSFYPPVHAGQSTDRDDPQLPAAERAYS